MADLRGKTVVVGVTGGIAAYKACEIVSRLRKQGLEVFVIMTRHAAEFVAPLSFETLSNHPVVTDMFKRDAPWEVEHISLAKRADLFLIAPATANIIAKMAVGLADDMLSTTVMATTSPVLLAPAMNTNMYLSAATQHNLQMLKSRGVHILPPATGFLAEGISGVGRLPEPPVIVQAALAILGQTGDLSGMRVLISAGPTREALDPVRYITNHSSGKMGFALAEAAHARGAQVTVVAGPVQLPTPMGVTRVDVESTAQMRQALLERFEQSDITIKAAAPADYRPQTVAQSKIKKRDGDTLNLPLVENPDIAAELGAKKRTGQVLVGFAAETGEGLDSARGKIARKNLDFCVLNDVTQPGAGFSVDTNIATLVYPNGDAQALELMSKRALADKILDAALAARKA